MDTLAQMRTAAQRDLSVNSSSTFFSPTIIDAYLNRAKRKVEALYRWPGLEDAQTTSTVANQEYYDYPSNWRPFSIWKIWIDSNNNDFRDPLVFKDYLYEKENDFPDGKRTIWANQWKRFFVLIDGAAPTTTGNNNIRIWGMKATTDMSVDDDTTIFSYAIPEVNEAIVLEAVAMLKDKAKHKDHSNIFISPDAKSIVDNTWGKIRQEQAKFEKTQPFFEVPDFFKNKRSGQNTGNFDL